MRNPSDFCSSAVRKVCIRLSAPRLHLEMVQLLVTTVGAARPLKAACSGTENDFVTFIIFHRHLCEACAPGSRCWSMPQLCPLHAHVGPYTQTRKQYLTSCSNAPSLIVVSAYAAEHKFLVALLTYSHLISGLDLSLCTGHGCCDRICPGLKALLLSTRYPSAALPHCYCLRSPYRQFAMSLPYMPDIHSKVSPDLAWIW